MSTRTHGTIAQKHAFSSRLSGKISKRIKRKRSLDEKTENKRDRLDENIDLEEEDYLTDSTLDLDPEETFSEEMAGSSSSIAGGSSNLAADLIKAMSDETVMGMLSSAFAKKISEDMTKKIEEVEMRVIENEKRADQFDQRIDNYEQRDLECNAIISGVPSDQATKDDIRKILNEKLKCNVATTDIQYIVKINGGEESEKSNVKIAFTSKEKKTQIMQAKKKLKGEDIWITDDLTTYRRNLAYQARQAVRNGLAKQTWVTDGKVFLKITTKDKPQKIQFVHEIPGHDNRN
jgi:hypothetical protein